jgi:RNA polymerase sigma-70 factor, ECF subfamily
MRPADQNSLIRTRCTCSWPRGMGRRWPASPDRVKPTPISLQDLHVALWRSRCSLRTWVYRVAHNTALTYVTRRRRSTHEVLCTLDELDAQDLLTDPDSSASEADYDQSAARLYSLIRRLAPGDSQIMLLYLQDLDAAEIATTTGVSPSNVATKIHRIKRLLTRLYHSEESSHE